MTSDPLRSRGQHNLSYWVPLILYLRALFSARSGRRILAIQTVESAGGGRPESLNRREGRRRRGRGCLGPWGVAKLGPERPMRREAGRAGRYSRLHRRCDVLDRIRGYRGSAQGARMRVNSRACTCWRRFVFASSFLRAASPNVSSSRVYSRTERSANRSPW